MAVLHDYEGVDAHEWLEYFDLYDEFERMAEARG